MKHYNNMKNLVVAVLTVAALQTMAALSTGAKVQPQNSAPKEVKSAAAWQQIRQTSTSCSTT